MIRISIALIMFGLLTVTLDGCNRRPSGMPDVFPCSVTVKNGGEPVAKAMVTFHREGGNGTVRISGITDAGGKATIVTRLIDYKAEGSPSGTFSVTIFKNPEIPDDGVDVSRLSEDEQQKRAQQQAEFEDNNRVVPEALTRSETTPLRCIVKEKEGGTLVVDLAEFEK